jgi:hypothetical protein
MDEVLATIRAFVAGDLSPARFREQLYADERFEGFLTKDPNLRADNYVHGSVYHFLLEQDFDGPGGVLNAQGALADFMDRNAIDYTKTAKYEDSYSFFLDVQPRWLAVDPRYVQDHMLPDAGERSGEELREWLRGEFLRRFRYVTEPPQWIQGPVWPISKNGPLVFLGQFDVNEYFHDAATVYVFYDPASESCETIIQVF